MYKFFTILLFSLTVLGIQIMGEMPDSSNVDNNLLKSTFEIQASYLNNNDIFMIMSNVGYIGRDVKIWFDDMNGMFFPYVRQPDTVEPAKIKPCIYSAGLWISGLDNNTGDTLVSSVDFRHDFVPGPMKNGTYMDYLPEFKIYKLYGDSLEDNPNEDYLNWPINQGAPHDKSGKPLMKGRQMLWTVFNDAYPDLHLNGFAQTEPIGVEVHQTTWSYDAPGDNNIYISDGLYKGQSYYSRYNVDINITNPFKNTGDTMIININLIKDDSAVWSLTNIMTGEKVIDNEPLSYYGKQFTLPDGYNLEVYLRYKMFESIEVVQNAEQQWSGGVGAAIREVGFPCNSLSSNQQVGNGKWAIHTADLADDVNDTTYRNFDSFLKYSLMIDDSTRVTNFGKYDWEIRFTGSNENLGVKGSYAWNIDTKSPIWVPFELWRTGIDTPRDPKDDVRCIIWVKDDGNGIFDLSHYGNQEDGNCGPGGCSHSAVSKNNGPFTDWFYWLVPENETAGASGYNTFELYMLTNPQLYTGEKDKPVFDRLVLINYNGGVEPPFNQDLPEQMTIFRIKAFRKFKAENIRFAVPKTELLSSSHPVSQTIFLEYKFYNNGSKYLKDAYFTIWMDPDLGYNYFSNLVGCDTILDISYVYNTAVNDGYYGVFPPAMGFKFIKGTLVPSDEDDTGWFGDLPVYGMKNSRMVSFTGFDNGEEPSGGSACYNYVRGLKRDGSPFLSGCRFNYPGDPVAGTGILDIKPDDKRMMASVGPFDFAPGDSQYVLIKIGAAVASDRIQTINKLKETLEASYPEFDYVKAVANPGIFNIYELNSVDEENHSLKILLGYRTQEGSPIDWNSVNINGEKGYDSVSIRSWISGFKGEAAIFYYDMANFIEQFSPIWDTVTSFIPITGVTVNKTGFVKHVPVSFVGHLSGDINYDSIVDITDLTLLIDYMFHGYNLREGSEAADYNHDGFINITDLSEIINFLFEHN